jgi:hypothetical protein
MILRQVYLKSGTTQLVCFVPDDKRLKVGTRLTLKDDDTEWTVEAMYAEMRHHEINRVWGLDLPKSQRTER